MFDECYVDVLSASYAARREQNTNPFLKAIGIGRKKRLAMSRLVDEEEISESSEVRLHFARPRTKKRFVKYLDLVSSLELSVLQIYFGRDMDDAPNECLDIHQLIFDKLVQIESWGMCLGLSNDTKTSYVVIDGPELGHYLDDRDEILPHYIPGYALIGVTSRTPPTRGILGTGLQEVIFSFGFEETLILTPMLLQGLSQLPRLHYLKVAGRNLYPGQAQLALDSISEINRLEFLQVSLSGNETLRIPCSKWPKLEEFELQISNAHNLHASFWDTLPPVQKLRLELPSGFDWSKVLPNAISQNHILTDVDLREENGLPARLDAPTLRLVNRQLEAGTWPHLARFLATSLNDDGNDADLMIGLIQENMAMRWIMKYCDALRVLRWRSSFSRLKFRLNLANGMDIVGYTGGFDIRFGLIYRVLRESVPEWMQGI